MIADRTRKGVAMPWSEWLGDSWISPPFLILFFLFGSMMAAAPLIRIYNAWYVDRVLDARLAFGLVLVHCAVMLTLWHLRLLGGLLLYLALVMVFGLCASMVQNISEWMAIRWLADDDIRRCRYILHANPDDALTRVALANAYVEKGRMDEALTEYDLAVTVDPHYAEHATWKLRQLIESRVKAKGKKKYHSDLHGEFNVPNEKITFTVEKDDMDIDLQS